MGSDAGMENTFKLSKKCDQDVLIRGVTKVYSNELSVYAKSTF